ncbi:anhydro-N-acetylmuramic acid kinase [Oceanibium sediminis]|uniref:anhydro-N-acetylmuramic acid kinase n=1 Tax=Oceanibium sediminis TaxID=2026339 RepID=UPI000DD4D51B|nr:anhydro-N-acetylmuramic acid kinase [Oceanibium sediminis]
MKLEEPVWALGLMSGTSMDGIDGAALLTDGVDILGFGPKRFEPFDPALRADLRAALGSWPGAAGLDTLEARLTEAHAALAGYFPTTEVVGFHGQTLAHDPAAGRTHQLGDGAALGRRVERDVVWDFRTADVASGGEGAPLVPFFHHALARMLNWTEVTAILNIGGVANVTWIDPNVARPGASGALLAFDTGPGNALLNDLMAARGGAEMDSGGALAATGTPDRALIAEVLEDPYFARPAPKSLDRDHFDWVLPRLADHSLEDAAATLTELTAAAVGHASKIMPEAPTRWLVTGGGRLNATMMRALAAQTNLPVEPVESVGLDGDFLEAQAFAYLAVRVMRGLATTSPDTTGARLPVCGGRIFRVETPSPVIAAVSKVRGTAAAGGG